MSASHLASADTIGVPCTDARCAGFESGRALSLGAMGTMAACSSDEADSVKQRQRQFGGHGRRRHRFGPRPASTDPTVTQTARPTFGVPSYRVSLPTTTVGRHVDDVDPVPTYDFSGVLADRRALHRRGRPQRRRLDRRRPRRRRRPRGLLGRLHADRVSLLASSSKMITAGVLLHLADDGLLDMDAPVADVVDWGAGNPTITPAQLRVEQLGSPRPAPRPRLRAVRLPVPLRRHAPGLRRTASSRRPDDDADDPRPTPSSATAARSGRWPARSPRSSRASPGPN